MRSDAFIRIGAFDDDNRINCDIEPACQQFSSSNTLRTLESLKLRPQASNFELRFEVFELRGSKHLRDLYRNGFGETQKPKQKSKRKQERSGYFSAASFFGDAQIEVLNGLLQWGTPMGASLKAILYVHDLIQKLIM